MSWQAAHCCVEAIDDVLRFVGLEVKKADSDVLSRSGFDALVRALSVAMAGETGGVTAEALRLAVTRLDRDWAKLTPEQREEALRKTAIVVGQRLAHGLIAAAGPVAGAASKTIAATRQATARKHQLTIANVFSAIDKKAVAHARETAAFFLRNTAGKMIAGALDKTAREIVARAIREGWSARDTGRELRAALSGTMAKRSTSYFQMAASVAIARARTYSQLSAFASAGFTRYRRVAVLDELTCDTCRALATNIDFAVEPALERFKTVTRGNVVARQPFLRVGKSRGGRREIYVPGAGGRKTIAEVVRSGVGTVDDRGEYARVLSPQTIQELGADAPPSHPWCRCTLVPVIESARQPGSEAEAEPETPEEPTTEGTPQDPPAPEFVAGVHAKELASNLKKDELDGLLRDFSTLTPWMLPLLERIPLGKLVIRRAIATKRANGLYIRSGVDRATGAKIRDHVHVRWDRSPRTFGAEFVPGKAFSVSAAGATREQAALRTLVHELGHHVNLGGDDPSEAVKIVNRAAAEVRPVDRITRYAGTSRAEYFAESFAAYVFERAKLKAHDPIGFAMVEDALRARGITL